MKINGGSNPSSVAIMPHILSYGGEEEEKAEFEVDLNVTTTLVKLKVVAYMLQ